jgi:hypothetical protein
MGDIGQQPNIQAESRQLCKLDLGKNYSFQRFLSDQSRHLRDIIAWQDLWRGLGKVTRNHASVSTSTWYYNGRNTVYYDTEDELQETKAALLYKIIQQ